MGVLKTIVRTALTFYEYVITFKHEVEIVWRKRFTVASYLLLSTRWTLLVGGIMLTLPPPDPEVRSHPYLAAHILTSRLSRGILTPRARSTSASR